MAVHGDTSSDDVGAAPVFPLPEAVSENCTPGAASVIVLGPKSPAEDRGHSQGFEVTPRNVCSIHLACFATGRQVEGPTTVGEDSAKSVLPVADLLPNRIAEVLATAAARGHLDQLLGMA